MTAPVRLSDLEYLLDLGVTVEDIARRAGRTPDAITAELREIRAERERDTK
ncbi:hypothetical protein SEA_BUMBLE_54 [Arthrobacter phage Bumble]|uniref:Uncharacterized protein n=1 Tax=Arthrobacter phage Bumble TaxID=2743904 RepID=A0A7G3WHY5_9CAUD|nr:hypothetical protein SEA_BUMBLE_54 [Arthrobacter phage Bumble]